MKKRLAWAVMFAFIFASGIATQIAADTQASPAAAGVFELEPYLYIHGTGSLALGWNYSDGMIPTSSDVQVQISIDSKPLHSVLAHYDGVSWSAELLIPECGYGGHVSYLIPGMNRPTPIEANPCPWEHKTSRFSFIADAQEGPEFLEDIAKEIAAFPGSTILSAGDLVQRGASISDWKDYFRALSPLTKNRVMLPAIGNHEYRSTPQTNYWQNYFRTKASNAYYSTHLGGAHLIVLNSSFEDDSTLIDSQIEWLKEQLAKPAPWKIVMFHHAPFSKGFFNGPGAIRKEHLILREKYVPLFEAYRVDLVLAGHTHIFEHSVKEGIHYIVAGPAGGKMGVYGALNPYSMKSTRERTVTHFEVNDRTLHAVTLSIENEVLDDLTLHR